MAITLTESRLRQIIREEVRLLGRKPRRSIKESAWDSSGAAADAMESILALARHSDFYDNRPTKENAMAIVDEVCDDLGSACPMSFRMEAVKQLMDNAGGVAAGWSEFAKKGY